MAEYIEREALLNELKEERKKGNFVFTSKWIKEIMDNLPAADVVEVKRGEWQKLRRIQGVKYYMCSLCSEMAKNEHNYCPNCGAKMDGNEKSY